MSQYIKLYLSLLQGKITAQGKLLLHGPLICSEGTSAANFKGKELQVFLFEQNIIFSEAVGKKTQFTNPVYIYKNHIQVGKNVAKYQLMLTGKLSDITITITN